MGITTIAQAREAKKGGFIGLVTQMGPISEGTKKDGSVWTKRIITLQDGTGTQGLTAWGADMDHFEINHKYEIDNPYWSEYQGRPQLSLGKYAKVRPLGQATLDDPGSAAGAATGAPPANAPSQGAGGGTTGVNPPPQEGAWVTSEVEARVSVATQRLLQIEKIIMETMTANKQEIIPAKIGLYTKIIYAEVYGK